MAEEAAAHHLLNVVEERDLNVDLDKVLFALEDEKTKRELADWVHEYLNDETLLTKEELELYESLKRRGILDRYEEDKDAIRPVLDHELSSAIDALESSSAAIAEQTRVLEAQRDALAALKALDKPNLAVEHVRNERRRREAHEKARLDLGIEDVITSIKEQMADAQHEMDVEKTALKEYVTQRLSSDDKMLAALPNIVSKLVAEAEGGLDEKTIEQMCSAIAQYRTADVKNQVEITYLKTLATSVPDDLRDLPEDELKARKEELQSELETLHSEIAAVNEMVVEHDFKKPITELQERKKQQRDQARTVWVDYVSSTLEYMTKRLQIIHDQAEKVEDFQRALYIVDQAASNHFEEAMPESLRSPRKRRESTPRPVFSPPVALKPSKPVELPPAIEDALRHAGIAFTQNHTERLREVLAKVQLEQEEKLSDQYSSAVSSTQEILADVLGKADVDLMGLIEALYTYTPFQTVHMSNQDLDQRMSEREQQLNEADMQLLTAEANELSLGDPKVRDFVAKWGGFDK